MRQGFGVMRSIYCVWHQSNVAGTFDRYRESSLVFCTGAGDPSRKDLSALGHIPFQFIDVLVIDIIMLFVRAECTNFLSSAGSSPSHRRIASFFIVSHLTNLLIKSCRQPGLLDQTV